MSEREVAAVSRLVELLERAQRAHEVGSGVVLCLYGRQGRGRTMRIAGPRSPRGEVLSHTPEGVNVWVGALDLAAWCCAQLQRLGVEVEVRCVA